MGVRDEVISGEGVEMMWIVGMLFFFFKQKTAYEIYQCDWSSDVCSSDLCLYGMNPTETVKAELINDLRKKDKKRHFMKGLLKIGRASCRERV